MATSALPRGKTLIVLQKDESSFGVLPSGNWTQTPIYSHTLEHKEPPEANPLLGLDRNNNRDTTAKAPGLVTLAGQIIRPLDYNHIGLTLKGAFGAATVSGSGDPYTHTFTSGLEVLPHRSIEMKLASNIFMQYLGMLTGKISIDLARKPGYDRVTEDLMGKLEQKATSTSGGTPTAAWALDQAPSALPIFKKDTVQVANITALKWSYDNKVKGLDYIGTKYISGHDLDDEATCEGTIEMRFLDATYYDIAVAGTAFAGEILWTKSASRSLSLAMPIMHLERMGVPVSGPGGIKQNFNFWCEQDATNPMVTAVLKSLVAVY